MACGDLFNQLRSSQGKALAQRRAGTPDQLFQEAIATGSGANAQEVLFVVVVAAVNFASPFQGGILLLRWAVAGLGSAVGLHGEKLGVDSFSFQGVLFSTYSIREGALHLLFIWGVLALMSLLFGTLTALFLKRKE